MALLLALNLSPKFKDFDLQMRKALRIISVGYFLLVVADSSFNFISTLPKSSQFLITTAARRISFS